MVTEIQETLDKDFSRYGQKFQLALLSLLIQDKSFASNIRPILEPEYFDNIYCQNICKMILDYANVYHNIPDFETLKTIIETNKEIISPKVYLMTLDSVSKANLSNREFVKQEAQKFCFTKFALKKIEEEVGLILKGDFTKARNISFEKYRPINTGVKEYDLKKDYSLVLQEKTNIPIPTNLPSINKISQGGPGAGNLCVVVAQSNFGKSNYLVSLAQNAAKEGKRVIYFSLETDGVQLMQRAIANLSNLQQETIKQHPLLIKEKISKLKGNIKLIELKSTDACVDKLKMIIDEIKTDNFFPELIIVDGLNQVKPPPHIRFGNSNDKFEYLAEELRDLAKEERVPIWCAFQQNRSGFNKEIADEQSIGKAIEVYQVCDFMLMFTQSVPQQEQGECYVQVLKNRLGPKGLMLKLKYDPDRVCFIELETVQRSLLYDKQMRKTTLEGLEVARKKLDEIRQQKTY